MLNFKWSMIQWEWSNFRHRLINMIQWIISTPIFRTALSPMRRTTVATLTAPACTATRAATCGVIVHHSSSPVGIGVIVLTHWPLVDVSVIFKVNFSNTLQNNSAGTRCEIARRSHGESHRIPLNWNQDCFRLWLNAVELPEPMLTQIYLAIWPSWATVI